MLSIVIFIQVLHLLYHQITTLVDFFPFNSARFYSAKEKYLEGGVNLVLMGLPPIGFYLHKPALMGFGVVYYGVLFVIELATWWVPYFFKSSNEWRETYKRLHKDTLVLLPARGDNPIPNVEHMVLHSLTLVTGITTAVYYFGLASHPGN